MAFVWVLAASVPAGLALGQTVDGRFAGFMDYANGEAVLLLVGMLVAHSCSIRQLRRSRSFAIVVFVQAFGLYMTQSRAAFVLFAAALAFILITSRKSFPGQGLLTIQSAILGIGAAVAYNVSPVWALPVVFLWYMLISRVKDFAVARRLSRFGVAAAVPLLLAAIFYSSEFAERWKSVFSPLGEGSTRLVYYRDALAMIADSPLWGFGSGSWSNLQYRYQSSAYFTAFVHDHPLQLLTEVGIVGLLLFGAACALMLTRTIRAARLEKDATAAGTVVRIGAVVVLLAHSLVDFTLSYPYLLGLLFALGSTSSEQLLHAGADAAEAKFSHSGADAVAGKESLSGQFREWVHHSRWKKLVLTILPWRFGRVFFRIALLVAVLAYGAATGSMLVSNYYVREASTALAKNRQADGVHALDRAIRTAIFADRLHDRKARLYFQAYMRKKDRRYLEVAYSENDLALRAYPEHIWYTKLKSDILWEQDSREPSLQLLRTLVRDNPFVGRWREELKRKGG